MAEKSDLRTSAKEIRKNLNMKKISEKLVSLLRSKEYYKSAQNIMIFFPTSYEVDVTSLLNDDKVFYLPVVSGKNLKVCPYKKGDKLELSKLNIYEPTTAEISVAKLDLVVVPSLMVDKENYRLGYGGGFYDRFLNDNPHIVSVTLIPNDLITEKLPHDAWDIKLNYVISI